MRIIVRRGLQGNRGKTGEAAPETITVAVNLAKVITVADNIDDIIFVAENIGDIQAVQEATALLAVQAAESAVESALASQALAQHWYLDTTVTLADPTSGKLRFNASPISDATAIAISAVTRDAIGKNLRNFIKSWDDSTSTAKGYLSFHSLDDYSKFAKFWLSGAVVDNTSWLQVPIVYIDGNGVFSADETIAINFTPKGDAGSTTGNSIAADSTEAFKVGRLPSAVNAAFAVNTNTASSVNGIEAVGTVSGTNPIIKPIGPGADIGIRLGVKGTATAEVVGNAVYLGSAYSTFNLYAMAAQFSHAYRSYTSSHAYSFYGVGGVNLTASVDIQSLLLDFSQDNQRQTGAIAVQTDGLFKPSKLSAVDASVATKAVGWEFRGAPIASTNMTITTTYGQLVSSIDVSQGGTVGTSYAALFEAMSGATNNYGIKVTGGKSIFAASIAGYASINLAPGVDPSSAEDGDIWVKSTGGVFAKSNGVTQQLDLPSDVKAWVNFNGIGTIAILGSKNVSSITDVGVGDYRVNFTTALADANYAAIGTNNGSGPDASHVTAFPVTASQGAIRTVVTGVGYTDTAYVGAAFFR